MINNIVNDGYWYENDQKIKKRNSSRFHGTNWCYILAQRVHNGHKLRHGHNSPFVTTVVTRPVVTTKVSSKLSKNERLNMALTYLRTHPRLSVSKYSNLTGLGKLKAKAELDAFAMSKKIPIRMVVKCKRKYYILD